MAKELNLTSVQHIKDMISNLDQKIKVLHSTLEKYKEGMDYRDQYRVDHHPSYLCNYGGGPGLTKTEIRIIREVCKPIEGVGHASTKKCTDIFAAFGEGVPDFIKNSNSSEYCILEMTGQSENTEKES